MGMMIDEALLRAVLPHAVLNALSLGVLWFLLSYSPSECPPRI
jgi:hypothetical protein